MRIAIVKLSALGDIVHAMIVLQYIKKYNEEIKVDWFVEESYREILEHHPDINKVYAVKFKKAKQKKSLFILYSELKKTTKLNPYDLVIDMQGLIKSALLSKLIPSKKTFGFEKTSLRESFASIFYDIHFKMDYKENIIKRNFELIKFALNLPYQSNDINFKLPYLVSKVSYDSKDLSNSKKNILLILGGSHLSKRYPAKSFANLTYLLKGNYILIWGNKEEKSIANKIKKLAPEVNICPKLSILELISLTSQVDLVIGSDTGPTHIAWALNIPSITLFGGTPGYRNSYETKINKIIESDSKVNPYKLNRNDFSIKNIRANDVVKIAQYLLS